MVKKMVKISIIIPIYNKEAYLKNTIDYLKEQSFKDYEMIFINDCSTDEF